MKLKKLIIISIFLIAIFAISSVSAAQNDTQTDDIVQNSYAETNILEKNYDNTSLTQNIEDADTLGTGSEKLNLNAHVESEYVLDTKASIPIEVPQVATKKLSVYIDKSKLDTEISTEGEYPEISVDFKELGLKAGLHNITFKHPGDDRFAPMTKTYKFELVYFDAYIPASNWGDESGLMVTISPSAKGKVDIYADKKLFKKNVGNSITEEDQIRLDSLSYGKHDIEVRYTGPEGTFSKFGKFNNDVFHLSIEEYPSIEWGIDELLVFGPKKVSKQPTITVNGKKYKFKMESYSGTAKIDKNALKIGKNTLVFYYPGDSKYPKIKKTITVYVRPQILTPGYVGLNDKDSIIVNMPSNTKGKYTIYEIIGDDPCDLKYKKISSGKLKRIIYLPKLKAGDHYLLFEFTDSKGHTYKEEITAGVTKNSKEIKSSLKPKTVKYGREVTVKIKCTDKKLKTTVFISLDNEEIKYLTLKNGKASAKIQLLTPGKHKIKVVIDGGGKFYAKSYYVTVKKPTSIITLKTAKVKKSAKKLVLTATVKKPNKKPIKGKKVTFKFNNKVYKAKTNKKGIAKVTVKKSVLKKLKVGEKVKYEAKYQYSIKKVARVKK